MGRVKALGGRREERRPLIRFTLVTGWSSLQPASKPGQKRPSLQSNALPSPWSGGGPLPEDRGGELAGGLSTAAGPPGSRASLGPPRRRRASARRSGRGQGRQRIVAFSASEPWDGLARERGQRPRTPLHSGGGRSSRTPGISRTEVGARLVPDSLRVAAGGRAGVGEVGTLRLQGELQPDAGAGGSLRSRYSNSKTVGRRFTTQLPRGA